MNWFRFRQNSSGGVWKSPAMNLNVQAPNLYEARRVAFERGVYFNGVDDGVDCACCGDRWGRNQEESAEPYRFDEALFGGIYTRWSEESGVPLWLDVPWDSSQDGDAP